MYFYRGNILVFAYLLIIDKILIYFLNNFLYHNSLCNIFKLYFKFIFIPINYYYYIKYI